MKDKWILAPSFNESELLRTLARYGVNSFGWHITNGTQLAMEMLAKAGFSDGKNLVDRDRGILIIYDVMKKIIDKEPDFYFSNPTYSRAKDIYDSMTKLRMQVLKTEVQKSKDNFRSDNIKRRGDFALEKNKALLKIIDGYENYLNENNLTDDIGLMDLAIEKGKPFEGEFFMLKEDNPTPLEKDVYLKALGKSSSESEKLPIISITDLINHDNENKENFKLVSAYGTTNEIENVFSTIYKNKYPLDTCQIVLVNPQSDLQNVYDLSIQFKILTYYGCGVKITNSYPAMFVKKLKKWKDSFCNADSLKSFVFSNEFKTDALKNYLFGKDCEKNQSEKLNEVMELFGSMHLSTDKEKNTNKIEKLRDFYSDENNKKVGDIIQGIDSDEDVEDKKSVRFSKKFTILERLEYVEKLAGEFEKGEAYLIKKYASIRNLSEKYFDYKALDLAALLSLSTAYSNFVSESDNISKNIFDDLTRILLNKNVMFSTSKEGSVYVTSLDKAISSILEHIFVIGLSNDKFPGDLLEDSILKDEDIKEFSNNDKCELLSFEKLKNNEKMLRNLMEAAKVCGSDVTLSYSNFDLEELKKQHPASILYEYFYKDGKWQNREKIGYFDSKLAPIWKVGEQYKEKGGIDGFEQINDDKASIPRLLESQYSMSAIECFGKCPYKFYLKYILGAKEEENEDKFEVIKPIKLGLLFHSLMENVPSSNDEKSKEEFLDLAKRVFEGYLLEFLPEVRMYDVEFQKQKFINMAIYGFDKNAGKEVELIEKEIQGCYEGTGLTFYGYPDRIEKGKDDYFKIIDYKTGKTKKVDKVEEYLQILLYAYLFEKEKEKAEIKCEYQYPFLKTSKEMDYSEWKEELDTKISHFQKALTDCEFPIAKNILRKKKFIKDDYSVTVPNKKECEYCKFKNYVRGECLLK